MADFIDPEEQKKAREKKAKETNQSILRWMGKTPVAKYLKEGKRKLLSTYKEYIEDEETTVKVVDLAAIRAAKEKSGKDRK